MKRYLVLLCFFGLRAEYKLFSLLEQSVIPLTTVAAVLYRQNNINYDDHLDTASVSKLASLLSMLTVHCPKADDEGKAARYCYHILRENLNATHQFSDVFKQLDIRVGYNESFSVYELSGNEDLAVVSPNDESDLAPILAGVLAIFAAGYLYRVLTEKVQ